MTKLGKLLAFVSWSVARSAVPVEVNRSMRTVNELLPVFASTISVAHPPPAANCGKRIAAGPPIPEAMTGSGDGEERLVTGVLLKLSPRNLKPITAMGVADEIDN